MRQRLRLMPLLLSLRLADRLAGATPVRRRWSHTPWRPGISVVIPEREAPALLLEALASVHAALGHVSEPWQIVVVANGGARRDYDGVLAQYPAVELLHCAEPLGFSAAIDRGLRRVHHDWTLLMNNDMTFDPLALRKLAERRASDVFAVAAQIFQQNAEGRREETGLTDWYIDAGGIHVYHADPGVGNDVREHLCASGGAALFRTQPLQKYARASRCYDPFYWEDVEWGVQARRDGLRVLFCPHAHAWHRHRATTVRFYAPEEIERVVERNRLLFDIRNALTARGAGWLMARVCDLPYDSQRDFASLRQAAGVFVHRLRARRARRFRTPPRLPDPGEDSLEISPSYSFMLRGASAGLQSTRPRVLIVTPFCAFPPRHGGARRVDGLLRRLRDDFDVVFLSDEASLYDARSFAFFDGLHAVHLVQRPRDAATPAASGLGERMRAHCHEALCTALREALARYRPQIVQIEHIELAYSSKFRLPGQRWVLDLHDAFRSGDFQNTSTAAEVQKHVRESYDAVIVASPEDENMVSHAHTVCVPNGTDPAPMYLPSDSSQLLFMGPFRYAQNLEGIRQFLARAYPAIAAAAPSPRLLVLGGDGAIERTAGDALFTQRGVTVAEHRDDIPKLLTESALTLNPLTGIRGSAVKVIESLAAGRACISTEDGARGFLRAGFSGLITVPAVADMVAPAIELLTNPERRRRIETPDANALAPYRWEACAAIQRALFRELIAPRHG